MACRRLWHRPPASDRPRRRAGETTPRCRCRSCRPGPGSMRSAAPGVRQPGRYGRAHARRRRGRRYIRSASAARSAPDANRRYRARGPRRRRAVFRASAFAEGPRDSVRPAPETGRRSRVARSTRAAPGGSGARLSGASDAAQTDAPISAFSRRGASWISDPKVMTANKPAAAVTTASTRGLRAGPSESAAVAAAAPVI